MEIPTPASGWQSAFAEFVQTRLELIRIEARDAAQIASRKTRIIAIAAGTAVIAWILFLAAIIGIIHHFSQIPWWIASLGFAVLHFIIAIIAIFKLRAPSPPLFPVTRGEFQKDQQWMQTLKTPKTKSKD